ncbi:uncharacterized protein LOC122364063 [Amphibalanus amphitrite]|uniref:uncharacterized protein LOC122364063 n=1 Tax=Amphibalanus amphitrite TaxID=1232801 RepID=UPI001C91021E|nr:uncharacterized protein LOC122364063 [Amphibalanus amphitrite]XP_043190049.1 uncharacterized protein LOC122364063 [Amphibalanus amphitrite]
MRPKTAPFRLPHPLLLLLLLLQSGRISAREDVNLDELDPDMDRDIFRFCVACPLPPKTSAEYCRRVCARKNVPPPENFGSYVDWAEMCAHLCKYKLGGPNCTCELHRVFSFSVHDLFNN